VVKPLEAIMNAQSGVDHTFGYATNDFGLVTVQFKVGENQEDSLVKLYNQLMQNMDRVPPGAMEPMVKPINVDDVPIMTLTLASAAHDDFRCARSDSACWNNCATCRACHSPRSSAVAPSR
jgi:multidrug efflux pump subunit AcrB